MCERAKVEDMTAQVDYADNDGESLPLTKCVCGAKFPVWQEILSVYPESPWVCPQCGVKLFFQVACRVYKVL